MPVLTETIIDCADRHTIFAHFAETAAASPASSLTSGESYVRLHERLLAREVADTWGFRRLRPAYEDNKFWHRALASRLVQTYPTMAWRRSLPLVGDFSVRAEHIAEPGQAFRVSPVPRVMIYPFGFSAWVSIRVLGDHTLQDLADLVQGLFAKKAFDVPAEKTRMTVVDLFDRIASDVRRNLFGNPTISDLDTQDVAVFTTVLAKHGGSPAVGGMSAADEGNILRLVRPTGLPIKGLEHHVYRMSTSDPLEYLIFDDYGRFIWLEHLLLPHERNREHLQCYHANTFRSFMQAWHAHGLLHEALRVKERKEEISQLMAAALTWLDEPNYRNASLREYVQMPKVASVLKQATSSASR
jgi:hypothetical protein